MFPAVLSFSTRKPVFLLVIVCIAEVFSLLSFAAWPIYLVTLQTEWLLTNYQVGWISGAYFMGYVCATPFLVGITDRMDARHIYLFSAFLGGVGCLCFAVFATDFWTACLSWALVGAGLAGTYMPGLQILNARLDDDTRLRLLPYYTSSFGIGSGMSFLVMGWLYSFTDARTAFIISAVASFIALFGVGLCVAPKAVEQEVGTPIRHPLDFRPALRNQRALFYIFSYGAHSYELFAFRSWLFAFLLFVGGYHTTGLSSMSISTIVSVMAFMGMISSVLGAKFCMRFGRARMIRLYGLLTVCVSAAFGLAGYIDFWLLVIAAGLFNITIMLDSASLTAGTVESASPYDRGALLAVHSMIGFGGGALGGPVAGWLLDQNGGEKSLTAWAIAMGLMGVGSFIVSILMHRLMRSRA